MLKFKRLLLLYGGIICLVVCIVISHQCDFIFANEVYFIYDSKGKRDPFISLLGKNVKLTDVELLDSIDDVRVEGVIIDPKKGSAAIVNGRILKVGDFMGGFKLEKVTHYEIYMSRDGQKFKLQFRNKSDDEAVSDHYQ